MWSILATKHLDRKKHGRGTGCDTLPDSKGTMISNCLCASHPGSALPALLQACPLLWSSSPPAFLAFPVLLGTHSCLLTSQKGGSKARGADGLGHMGNTRDTGTVSCPSSHHSPWSSISRFQNEGTSQGCPAGLTIPKLVRS